MDRELRIDMLAIVCGFLQITGLLCIIADKVIKNPQLTPFLLAVFGLSGFAAIVRWFIWKKENIMISLPAIAGIGIMFFSFVNLLSK